jgi:hypothetical protein
VIIFAITHHAGPRASECNKTEKQVFIAAPSEDTCSSGSGSQSPAPIKPTTPRSISKHNPDLYTTTAMPGLLDLPIEILQEIIDIVLSGGQIDVHSSNALGLLLTCRAIHWQTSHLIRDSPCVYKMDLAIIDATWFYPTWTRIPMRQGADPGIVDRLDIRIIPCRTDEKDLDMTDTFRSTYRLEDTLNSIIERFLAIGVNGGFEFAPDKVAHAKQTFPRNLRVRTITIDFTMTDLTDINTPISHKMIPVRPVAGFVHAEHDVLYPVHPETAIAMHEVFGLRLMGQFAWRHSLRSLLERVGKFQMYECNDPKGKLVINLEIDAFLALDIPHPSPGELEERSQIRQRRKELGMSDGVPKADTAEA